jgi:predicted acylesterase/phospholipase RssA
MQTHGIQRHRSANSAEVAATHTNFLFNPQLTKGPSPSLRLPGSQRERARVVAENGSVRFENVVFAGGGNRCFWQAGFWSVAAPALHLEPMRVAAVSAGAAMACAIFSGTFPQGFARYKQAMAGNGSNLRLRNLLREQPVFPHGNMYREAILSCIDEQSLLRLHEGPEIRVLISCPPRWASSRMALLLGMIATGIDTLGKDSVHSSVGRRIGFRPLFISVCECRTPAELTDLIIASSCTPPLTPQIRRNGIALLDGGLVSNVPTEGVSEAQGDTLVLLTRQFMKLPVIAGRTYVQPSQPIPVAAWDYTNDAALQSTFDLGRRDGEMFCSSFLRDA